MNNIFENQYQWETFPYAIDESCYGKTDEAATGIEMNGENPDDWMTSDEIEKGRSEYGKDGWISGAESESKRIYLEDFVIKAMSDACARSNGNFTFDNRTWQLKDRSGHFIQLVHSGLDKMD